MFKIGVWFFFFLVIVKKMRVVFLGFLEGKEESFIEDNVIVMRIYFFKKFNVLGKVRIFFFRFFAFFRVYK